LRKGVPPFFAARRRVGSGFFMNKTITNFPDSKQIYCRMAIIDNVQGGYLLSL